MQSLFVKAIGILNYYAKLLLWLSYNKPSLLFCQIFFCFVFVIFRIVKIFESNVGDYAEADDSCIVCEKLDDVVNREVGGGFDYHGVMELTVGAVAGIVDVDFFKLGVPAFETGEKLRLEGAVLLNVEIELVVGPGLDAEFELVHDELDDDDNNHAEKTDAIHACAYCKADARRCPDARRGGKTFYARAVLEYYARAQKAYAADYLRRNTGGVGSVSYVGKAVL